MKQRMYSIGNKVYHVTPDSPQGIVLDCTYSLRHNEWTYLVAFGVENEPVSCYDEELSFNKMF